MRAFTITLSILLSLVFVGLLGYSYWFAYGLWAIACYAGIILALPLSSLMHELGHMFIGAMCKVRVKPHFSLFGNSYCDVMPKTDKNLKTRVFFTAMGGILMNLLLFALGLLGIYLGGYFRIAGVVMPACTYLLLMNIMPAEFASGKTDGLILNNLLNNTDEAKVMLAVLGVQAQVLNGRPIGEVNENLLFDLPVIREDDPSFIALCELRYKYCEAVGNTAEAEKYKTRFEQLKEEYM